MANTSAHVSVFIDTIVTYHFGSSAFARSAENRNRLWICHQVNYLGIGDHWPPYEFLY